MGKNIIALLTVILFTLLAMAPLFSTGFPPTHDGEYHVIRFYEFFRTLSSGVMYPRWAADLNNGYGIPLFNYVYPLPNFIASFFHALGFSFIDSFKYNLILATLIGALGFYFFAKYFTNSFSGIVGAVLYVFAPYRLVDVYVRGSVGEVWSLAILPVLLWSLAILIRERKYPFLGLAGLLFGLLIFSHNILAILFLPFIFSFVGFLIWQTKKRKQSLLLAITSLTLGVGMTAIFWLPALFEKKYARGLEVYDFNAHFSDIPSLLFPSWGTGFAGDAMNGMSTQIGLANLFVILLSFALVLFRFKRRNSFFFFTVGWLLLAIFFTLPFSAWFWSAIPFFHFVQFPWRYLSLVIFLCSFLAALLIYTVRWKMIVGVSFVLFAVITTINYTKPAYYHNREDSYYLSRGNFIDSTNSPGNVFNTLWMNAKLPKRAEKFMIVSGVGTITKKRIDPQQYIFAVNAKNPVKLLINTAFFPGWQANIPGKRVLLTRTKDGLMELSLPKGESFVTVSFADTIVRKAGILISLFSCVASVILSGFFIRFRRKK